MPEEDERVKQPDLCRATKMLGGHEFICVLKAHAPVYERHTKRTRDVSREFVSNSPRAYFHYYIRRYPMGDH